MSARDNTLPFFCRNQEVPELGTYLINQLLSVHGKFPSDTPADDEIDFENVVRESFMEIKGNRDFFVYFVIHVMIKRLLFETKQTLNP